MSLDEALKSELAPINAKIAELQGKVAGVEGVQQVINRQVDTNTDAIALLNGAEPPAPPDPPGPTPDPGPVVPVPVPSGRRFGCNVGYKVDKSWSPDKPDHPRYAQIIAPVGACLRFMDWWKTNDDLNSGGGITHVQKYLLDRQIDLCNTTNSAMHLCLLFHDNADTIRYKVGRVRDRLNPGNARYIEWTNEPWNLGTNVSKEIQRISGVNQYGGGEYLKFFDVWAEHASRAFRVAKDEDPNCVTVLGCLTANKWVAQKVEDRLTTKPDAHGLTFYFGAGLGGTPDPNTSVNDILASAAAKIESKELPRIRDHARWSKSIGARIVGYEGGPHFTIDPGLHASHKSVWQNMNKANRDPRIIPLCERVASTAEAEGYETLNWFNLCTLYDQWGSWGALESLDNPDTPKYRYAAGLN